MRNQWFISIKKNTGDIFDLSNLTHNYPPDGYYWADPFLYKKGGVNYLFYEFYDYQKGKIAYSIINKDLTLSKPTIILDEPYHMSYPFIFEDKGELYIIPESGASGKVRLFKCKQFPDIWEEQSPLLEGSTSDNNIYKLGEYYLMFTTGQPQMKHDLFILGALDVKGPWQVMFSESLTNSRSAGNIFELDGNLIRPVQDASRGYGSGIHFKKIDINMDTGIYDEEVIHSIDPDWHPEIFGTHHFSFNDDLIVLDGKRKINS